MVQKLKKLNISRGPNKLSLIIAGKIGITNDHSSRSTLSEPVPIWYKNGIFQIIFSPGSNGLSLVSLESHDPTLSNDTQLTYLFLV